MLISCSVLKNSIDKLNENSRESYHHKHDNDSDGHRKRCVACVVLAILILVIEIAALYFALDIAVNTTQSGAERFIHVLLAVTITMPYLLFSVLLNPKANKVLTGGLADVKFKMCGGSSRRR